MNNELLERYERAVADTNKKCKLEEEAWLTIDKFCGYSQFESVHNARMNRASREASIAREVIAELKKRIEELPPERQWNYDPENAPLGEEVEVFTGGYDTQRWIRGFDDYKNLWVDGRGFVYGDCVICWRPLPKIEKSITDELNELITAYLMCHGKQQEWVKTYERRMSSSFRIFWKLYYRAFRVWIRR